MIYKEFIQNPNNSIAINDNKYFNKTYSDNEFNVFWIENKLSNKIRCIVLPSGMDLSNKKNMRLIFNNELDLFHIEIMPFTNSKFKIDLKKKELKDKFRFISFDKQLYKFI